MFKRFGNTKEERQAKLREMAEESRARRREEELWNGAPTFKAGNFQFVVRADIRTCLYIQNFESVEIPFQDVVDIRTYTEGISKSETRRKGTVGRALVGGIVAGGAGAIVGGMTARSHTTSYEAVTEVGCICEIARPDVPNLRFPIWYGGEFGALRTDILTVVINGHVATAERFADSLRRAFRG